MRLYKILPLEESGFSTMGLGIPRSLIMKPGSPERVIVKKTMIPLLKNQLKSRKSRLTKPAVLSFLPVPSSAFLFHQSAPGWRHVPARQQPLPDNPAWLPSAH